MSVPINIDDAVTEVDATLAAEQSAYRAAGNARFFQRDWWDDAQPGLMHCAQCYTHGEIGEGWLLRSRYTDENGIQERVTNHGPASLDQEWTVIA